jgi:hypothetical protein
MTYLTETLKQGGYRYIKCLHNGAHILESSSGIREVWANSLHHAGYRLKYKNTHLEFCASGADL